QVIRSTMGRWHTRDLGKPCEREQRMQELGVPVPDADTVRLSRWLRLQARIAPVDRLLVAREAAETGEVEDLYLRPTGDEQTDALLRDIRRDERAHSLAVSEMRSETPAVESAPVAPAVAARPRFR